MAEKLTSALDMERRVRREAAQAEHDHMVANADSPKMISKADRRLAKSLAKADKLHAKSLKALGDGKTKKMQKLVLSMQSWMKETPTTEDGDTVLTQTLDEAHSFIAEAIGAAHIGPAIRWDDGRGYAGRSVGDDAVDPP